MNYINCELVMTPSYATRTLIMHNVFDNYFASFGVFQPRHFCLKDASMAFPADREGELVLQYSFHQYKK